MTVGPACSCSQCGASLVDEGPAGGLCPRCLLDPHVDGKPAPANGECVPGDEPYAGPYRLLRLLGEGGMGLVYLAEQSEPIHRTVALKLIKLGMDTPAVISRFDSERQALAMMDHPNIAQIYDAGATPRGRPYFVMEYVPGIPVTSFCRQNDVDLRGRLELFLQVAAGVQHAHEKGILHRDIKPSNVLVMVQDGRAVPKIIDFGLAKATGKHFTEGTFFTEAGILVGTPEYMSPEQAAMGAERMDTRADIYSLGVLLYELLAGARPFDFEELREGGYVEMLRMIRDVDPPAASLRACALGNPALARQLRGDLDWITMKAIEKDPARRYASASELAADVRRHLHDEPVIAGPLTAGYRLLKFVRKNRIKVAAALVVVACLIGGLGVSTGLYLRAERQRSEAERQRLLTERQSYASNLAASELLLRTGAATAARQRLTVCPAGLRGWEWRHLWYKSDPALVTLAAQGRFLRHPGRHPHASTFAFSRDGTKLYWNTTETVEVWPASTLASAAHGGVEEILAMSRDGAKVVAGSRAETNVLRVIDVTSGRVSTEFRAHSCEVRCAAFTFGGERIASVSQDGALWVWDAATGARLATMRGNCPLAFRADGAIMAAGADDRTMELKDARGVRLASLVGHGGLIYSVAFSRDGSRVVSASADGTARIWNARTGLPVAILRHNEEVRDAAFSPDGTRIATLGAETEVRIWDSAGRPVATLPVSFGNSVAFTPDGNRVLAGSEDRSVRVWDLVQYSGTIWKRAERLMISMAAGAGGDRGGGERIAAGFADGTIEVWDAAGGKTLAQWRGHQAGTRSVAFSPDGTRIVSGSDDRTARLWDAASGAEMAAFEGHRGAILAVAFSSDGLRIATASEDGSARIWSTAPAGEIVRMVVGEAVSSVAFSPDGASIVTGSGDPARPDVANPAVRSWNTATGAARMRFDAFEFTGRRAAASLKGVSSAAMPVAFSPDGLRVLAAFRLDEAIRVFSASSGNILATLSSTPGLSSFAISPDGTRIVAASSRGMVQVWDAVSNEPLLSLPAGEPVETVAFSLGGDRLLALSRAGVRAWDSRSPHRIGNRF
ncbi:MAG: serine/threonine protein kinase [Acidobacteria bacterium]|nr:serine/threonine protein kinase [Acidobacteriota bacterium]